MKYVNVHIFIIYIIFNIQYIQPICLTQCTLPKTRKKHMSRPPKTSSTFTRCFTHLFWLEDLEFFPSCGSTWPTGTPKKNPKYLITPSPTYKNRGPLVRSHLTFLDGSSFRTFFLWGRVCVLQRQMLHAEILSSLFQAIKPWSRRNPEVAVNGFFSPLFWMTFFGNQCFSCTWKYW